MKKCTICQAKVTNEGILKLLKLKNVQWSEHDLIVFLEKIIPIGTGILSFENIDKIIKKAKKNGIIKAF